MGRSPKTPSAALISRPYAGRGPEGVVEILKGLRQGEVAVVNALEYADLEVVAAADRTLKMNGEELLVRSAASFIPVLAGIASGREVTRDDIDWGAQDGRGLLVVVGSHVEVTNRQLAHLLEQPGVTGIEISVRALQEERRQEEELRRVRQVVESHLAEEGLVVVYTSRDVLTGAGAKEYLDIGHRISDSLSELVATLSVRPKLIVAKGGITSSDVATKGLKCKEATVLGQAIPGVAVWHMGEEATFPGIPYVVFPGNVGGPSDLTRVIFGLWPGAAA